MIILITWFLASIYFGLQICSETFSQKAEVLLVHPLKVTCTTNNNK